MDDNWYVLVRAISKEFYELRGLHTRSIASYEVSYISYPIDAFTHSLIGFYGYILQTYFVVHPVLYIESYMLTIKGKITHN